MQCEEWSSSRMGCSLCWGRCLGQRAQCHRAQLGAREPFRSRAGVEDSDFPALPFVRFGTCRSSVQPVVGLGVRGRHVQTDGMESEICFFSKLPGLKSQCCDLEGEVLGCCCGSIPGLRACSDSCSRRRWRCSLSANSQRNCSTPLWAALSSSGSV